MRVARERRESGALAARGGACARGVKATAVGPRARRAPRPSDAPRPAAARRAVVYAARAGRRRCAPAGVTRARTRRAFAGGLAGTAPRRRARARDAARARTPRARPSVAPQVGAAEQPGEARTSENAAPQKWRAGLTHFYLYLA